MAGWTEKSPGVAAVTWKCTVCAVSSGPGETFVAHPAEYAPLPTLRLGPAVKLGGSSTGVRVIAKVAVALSPPSESSSVTGTVVTPKAFAAVVSVRFPAEAIAGWTENRAGVPARTWDAPAGPA